MTRGQKWYILVWLAVLLYGVVISRQGLPAWAAEGGLALPEGLAAPAQPTPMPDFSVPSVSGTTIQAAELQGKVVVVRFWATW
jgi:cytochrome oxidase Cu insertion factor (SCO1/SenC/PrrC family)